MVKEIGRCNIADKYLRWKIRPTELSKETAAPAKRQSLSKAAFTLQLVLMPTFIFHVFLQTSCICQFEFYPCTTSIASASIQLGTFNY